MVIVTTPTTCDGPTASEEEIAAVVAALALMANGTAARPLAAAPSKPSRWARVGRWEATGAFRTSSISWTRQAELGWSGAERG